MVILVGRSEVVLVMCCFPSTYMRCFKSTGAARLSGQTKERCSSEEGPLHGIPLKSRTTHEEHHCRIAWLCGLS